MRKTKKRMTRMTLLTHCLRASGITQLYQKGIDSTLIRELTQHQSVDAVFYYKTGTLDENITKNLYCDKNTFNEAY